MQVIPMGSNGMLVAVRLSYSHILAETDQLDMLKAKDKSLRLDEMRPLPRSSSGATKM